MWLGDEYQNFLIFIALIIPGDEGWTTNLQYVPPNLAPATKVGEGARRRGGNQVFTHEVFKMWIQTPQDPTKSPKKSPNQRKISNSEKSFKTAMLVTLIPSKTV